MNENQIQLVNLLSLAIRGLNTNSKEFHADLHKLFQEAVFHKVDALLFEIVSSIIKDKDLEVLQKWKRTTMISSLQQIKNIEGVTKVINKFHQQNIPVIILKGLSLRDLYPRPELRWMSDADILVHKKDISKARMILESMGYFYKDDHDPKEIRYYHKSEMLIELHWRITIPGYIENDDSFEDTIWDNAITINYFNTTALILSIDDVLLHMLIHMVFHIKNGGFGLRLLCDFVLFIEKKGDYIDWNNFNNRIKLHKIERFANVIFIVCNKLFKLKIPEKINIDIDKNDKLIDDLINDIIESGHFANKSPERKNIKMLIQNNYDDEKYVTNKFRLFVKIIFPSRKGLAKNYTYLHDYPLLYPIAWLQRIYVNVLRKLDLQGILLRFKFSKSTFDNYKKRVKMLKWLGLRL